MFGELYVNMVRAGEATGNVDVVLKRLADYLQAQRALRRKVVSALTYPAMMICIGMIVVSILMTVVVPKITGMLTDTGQTLPTPTKILIATASSSRTGLARRRADLAVIFYAFERVYKKSDSGRLFIDRTCCACRSSATSCGSRPSRASRARSRRCSRAACRR
jgi:general secretion pathway protein F